MTLSMVEEFMRQHKLKRPQDVWLQNIREMLETSHNDIKDNEKIFWLDRDDYKTRMFDRFLVIWQAGENDEFLITSNGFGIFEGVTGSILGSPFGFSYHSFYVISPKLVLVLCHQAFRKELGTELTELTYKFFGNQRSIFENAPHPAAIPNYVCRVDTSRRESNNERDRTPFDIVLNTKGFERHSDDTFTFPFVKLTSDTVRLVNFILLNETKPDLVLTFLSLPYLYKTIVKYQNDKVFVEQDFSKLKRRLFKELNQTHKEDLRLRKNIPADNTCSWNEKKIKGPNNQQS